MAGQLWSVNSLGGFLSAKNLSKELRTALQPRVKFRQFCDVKDAAGKNKGQTFTWDIVSDISAQGTTLTETNTMPEGQFTITQGTLTITEYGQAVPYSGKLESLSEIGVRKPIMTALKNDATKAMDIAAHAQFDTCLLRVVPTGGTSSTAITLTTTGTATNSNAIAFNNNHAKAIVDVMKERNIPAYTADDYYAIAWPTTLRTFKNNLESIHQYTPEGLKMIMNGEVGRYENVRYVEQTNISKGTWGGGVSGWIFFFGEDTVAEGIAEPMEVRAKIPSDYGRSKGVAWYMIGGFGKVHQSAAQERIVKWDTTG